jgi:SAM-dependent methyltransferase
MDFGCGTGLVALALQPLVRSVTGVDSSQGTHDVLAAKIARQGLGNVRKLFRDRVRGDALGGRLAVRGVPRDSRRDSAASAFRGPVPVPRAGRGRRRRRAKDLPAATGQLAHPRSMAGSPNELPVVPASAHETWPHR